MVAVPDHDPRLPDETERRGRRPAPTPALVGTPPRAITGATPQPLTIALGPAVEQQGLPAAVARHAGRHRSDVLMEVPGQESDLPGDGRQGQVGVPVEPVE